MDRTNKTLHVNLLASRCTKTKSVLSLYSVTFFVCDCEGRILYVFLQICCLYHVERIRPSKKGTRSAPREFFCLPLAWPQSCQKKKAKKRGKMEKDGLFLIWGRHSCPGKCRACKVPQYGDLCAQCSWPGGGESRLCGEHGNCSA